MKHTILMLARDVRLLEKSIHVVRLVINRQNGLENACPDIQILQKSTLVLLFLQEALKFGIGIIPVVETFGLYYFKSMAARLFNCRILHF